MNTKVLKISSFLSAVCMIFTSCGAAEKDSVKTLNTVSYEKNDLSKTLEVSGTVESTEKDSVITTDLVGYKVKKLNFNVGDHVSAGDVVCELDTTDLEKEIADLEKSISDNNKLSGYKEQQIQNQLEDTKRANDISIKQAQENLQNARNKYNDYKSAYEKDKSNYDSAVNEANNLKSQAQNCGDGELAAAYMQQYEIKMSEAATYMQKYETNYNAMKETERSITSLENALESAKISADSSLGNAQYNLDAYNISSGADSENQKQLDKLKKNLENSVIKADRDGIISNISAKEGKTVENGMILTIQSASDICVHVNIDEKDMLSVQKGMKAVVNLSAKKDSDYEGEVDKIVDIKSQNGFDSYISVDDTSDFRIGMTAKVIIYTVNASDVLSVKSSAVFTDDDGNSYVYEAVSQADDLYTLNKVKVDTGISNEKFTEITAAELEENDIIIAAPGKCSEGDTVKIKKPKKAGDDDNE